MGGVGGFCLLTKGTAGYTDPRDWAVRYSETSRTNSDQLLWDVANVKYLWLEPILQEEVDCVDVPVSGYEWFIADTNGP